jgi:hypothetical protein
MSTQDSQKQGVKTPHRTQAQIKADKRAAALRDNLKKRKAVAKEKTNKE